MGQLLGRARVQEASRSFVNLDVNAVYTLWESFNDVAEGFGINVEEAVEIFSSLQNTVFAHAPKQAMRRDIEALFIALDTDKNSLVDALEVLVTIAMLSGLELRDKSKFCFMCYDFDESEEITIDELTLLLKSCVTGLCKLSETTQVPEEIKLEQIAQEAFKRTGKTDDVRISVIEFIDYCLGTPEINAWFNAYDDAPDYNAESLFASNLGGGVEAKKLGTIRHTFTPNLSLEEVLHDEGRILVRDEKQTRARDPDCFKLKKPSKDVLEKEIKMARPWKETILATVPSGAPAANLSQPDEDSLQLDWVHGYSAQSCRNNLRYTVTGDIVYSAASVGVVYSAETHEQRFNVDHTDHILAIAIHPDGNTVATGEVGTPPKIHIWDSTTTRLISTIRGNHSVGVSSLAFSPETNSKWLVSVGQDPEHTINVYDWTRKILVFSQTSTRNTVLDVLFRWPAKDAPTSVAPSLVTCGREHILFWNQENNNRKKKGIFGKIGPPQSMLSLACNPKNNRVVSGSLSGHLYYWDTNRSLQRTVKAHDSAVTALFFYEHGLLSGGEDGKVRMWSDNLEQGAVFDVAGLGSLSPGLSSVSISTDGSRLLVGTRGSEIFEMSAEDGSNLNPGPLVSAHFEDQLHGLCVHPHKSEFCTVGDDKTVRIWDTVTKRMIRMVKLDTKARACSYSPDGSLIAIGLGSGYGNSKKDGAFVILNEADLCIVHEARDSKRWISDIKFSGDGATLGIASTDHCIYLYNVEDFASKGKCKGHRGGVLNMDFSEDNQCVQSNCEAQELLFWNANTGEQYKKPSTMKDVEWVSQNTPVGWSVQGLSTVALLASDKSRSGSVVASGDDSGRLRLHRYPCIDEKQGFHQFRGHSGAIRRVRFMSDDSFLLSIGESDRCVMQWKHEADESDALLHEDPTIYRNQPDSEDEEDFADGVLLDRSTVQEKVNNQEDLQASSKADAEYLDDTDEEDVQEDTTSSEESRPERPWVRLAMPPSVLPKENPTAPDESLALEWVHGISNSRNNLRYLMNGDIVYTAANLAIVLNKQGVQRFFTNHSDQVVALDVHPEGKLVVTSQMGSVPKIIIWDSDTMEGLVTLSGFHKRGINCVKFSRDGNRIVSVGLDEEHKIAVHDWRNGIVTSQCNGGREKVLQVNFNPLGTGLVQCGVNHIKFHTLNGRNVLTKRGILGKKGKLQAMYCIGWLGNRPVIGTADGHLYSFEGRVLQQAVKGHEQSVFALYSCSEGLVSGGKDGKVKVWSGALEIRSQFEICPVSIRSVCWDPDSNKILLSTRDCQIREVSASDGSDQNNDIALICGHSKHELWGLSMHPTKNEYCTVGDDQTVRVWDVVTHRVIKTQKLDTMARACAYSPDGTKIAIGLGARVGKGRQKKDGSVVILNEKDLVMIHEGRNSKQWVTDIKYSPDGATLALGSYDNSLYLYDVAGGYAVKGVYEGHNSFITHFDISNDGQYVMTNCGAHEMKYCDANSGTDIPAVSTLKDVPWSTWTCPLGWPVKGIHDPSRNLVEVSAVHRSSSGTLLASVDECGGVALRRFPCVNPLSGRKSYRGHRGEVRNVRFTPDDLHVITVGGTDRCVMQWRITLDEEDAAIKAGDSGRDSDIVFESKAAGRSQESTQEFVSIRPWINAVVPPTGAPSASVETCPVQIELEHVYGHRGEDVRSTVQYNAVGQPVYFGASVGIIYDKAEHSQQFYMNHDGRPIVSLAMHPNGRYVATGEGSSANRPRPHDVVRVHIWSALTGAAIAKLPAKHTVAASQLGFSKCGTRLVSVGEDENHTICVWRSDSGTWTDTYLQASAMAGQEKVLFALFAGSGLVTGGVNHILFWSLAGSVLTPMKGLFGRKGKIQPLLCAAVFDGNKVVSGTVTGHLYVWSGRECVKSIKAHERSVNSLFSCSNGLVSGSKDGVVKLWDTRLSPIRTFDMTEALPMPHRPTIRSVCWDPLRGVVLIGTQGSEIFEVSTENQSVTLLSQGHSADEVHGLAPHPSNPDLLVTGGDDQTVRLWDTSTRKLVKETNVGCMTRAVSWSPCGSVVGVGLGGSVGRGRQKKDGAMMVLDSKSLELVHETRDSKEWIADCKYSPDGETFAVASCDNKIYLYDVRKNYELRAKCEGHSSFVLHIDFSDDSEYLRSNCGGFDMLFHKVEDGSMINSPSMLKDVQWSTCTCTLSWYVQGMWPEVTDGTHYNSCDSSLDLLASGDDQGNLNLFNFPCITKGSRPLRRRAHISQVTNVRFNSDRSRIFTTGGADKVVCQWKITTEIKASNPTEQENKESF